MTKPASAILAATLAAPLGLSLLVAGLTGPLAASCAPGVVVTNVPETLTATTADGIEVVLDRTQLGHAATIISVGARVPGATREALVVALTAALTESRLRNYANPTYPETLAVPHDAVGTDHDSTGLFQMRHATGWGSVADLMDPEYQVRAFLGGPSGPNAGNPPGLLDIAGWQRLTPSQAAQAVERSAFPDRYDAWVPVAITILDALTGYDDGGGQADCGHDTDDGPGALVFPLPAGTWTLTSGFGHRIHPITGVHAFHAGTDYSAPAGTPVLAAAGGRVAFAGPLGGCGTTIEIDHGSAETRYCHLARAHVTPGQQVAAGQHIGDVGSTGYSTGPHLHQEARIDAALVDAHAWLTGATSLDRPSLGPTGCYINAG